MTIAKLAENWLVLFQSYAGTNPQTQQKFRLAMQQEPHLMKGTWMTPAVLEWLQQAIGVMMQRRVSASKMTHRSANAASRLG
jgi:DNA-binding transcriptional regulator PaaX